MRNILAATLTIALTDIALQLDQALAISSVASGVAYPQRVLVLGGGVALAALCLLGFTIVGSQLVDRLFWLKPVAGALLMVIGGQLVWGFLRDHGPGLLR